MDVKGKKIFESDFSLHYERDNWNVLKSISGFKVNKMPTYLKAIKILVKFRMNHETFCVIVNVNTVNSETIARFLLLCTWSLKSDIGMQLFVQLQKNFTHFSL